jgi:hypothetical protein
MTILNQARFIVLQKIPNKISKGFKQEDYARLMKELYGSEVKKDEIPDLALLERIYRGDMATFQLATFMQSHLEQFVGSPEINTQLVELQKVGNVIYLQLLVTVQNVTVNGKKMPVFFVRHEEIFIADQNTMTVITITVPAAGPAPTGTASGG